MLNYFLFINFFWRITRRIYLIFYFRLKRRLNQLLLDFLTFSFDWLLTSSTELGSSLSLSTLELLLSSNFCATLCESLANLLMIALWLVQLAICWSFSFICWSCFSILAINRLFSSVSCLTCSCNNSVVDGISETLLRGDLWAFSIVQRMLRWNT